MIPQDVPGIVNRLQEDLLRPRYAGYVQGLAQSITRSDEQWEEVEARLAGAVMWPKRGTEPPPDAGFTFCRQMSNLLNITRLFHVSEPMGAVARQVAERLPKEAKWEEHTFPSHDGMMFYQNSLILMDVWNRPVTIAAVHWHWSPWGVPGDGRPGWAITLFSDITDMRDYYFDKAEKDLIAGLHLSNMDIGKYVVFEMSFLPMGVSIGTWIEDNHAAMEQFRRENIMRMPEGELPEWDHNGPPSTANLGRINWAVFMLMQQEIATVTEEEDRRLRRRNRGKKRPPHAVTVIELRRKHDFGEHDERTGRFLTYRSITSGHPRRVHTRDGVKWVWIHPYVRGPEDAPFHQTKRITTLKR